MLSTFLEPPDGAPFWEGEVLNAGSRISLWPSPAITEGAIHQSSVSLRTGLVLLGQGQSGSDQVLRPSLGLLFVHLGNLEIVIQQIGWHMQSMPTVYVFMDIYSYFHERLDSINVYFLITMSE